MDFAIPFNRRETNVLSALNFIHHFNAKAIIKLFIKTTQLIILKTFELITYWTFDRK